MSAAAARERPDVDQLVDEMIATLVAARDAVREKVEAQERQTGLDEELRPLLQAQNPDWSMLERLRDVADEYAGRARQLRRMITERGADDEALDEVDELCRYFDSTAGLIARETGDAEDVASPPAEDEAGRG